MTGRLIALDRAVAAARVVIADLLRGIAGRVAGLAVAAQIAYIRARIAPGSAGRPLPAFSPDINGEDHLHRL